jgi:replicative DNA helicase
MQITVGTTTLLVGATGSGKTSCALNMLETSNAIDQPSMFFSMDMHKTLVYQKLAQKVTNYSGSQIKQFYATKNREKIDEIRNAITEKFGKTYFDFSSTLTLEEMEAKIRSINDKNPGNPIRLVIVDYAGRVSGPHSDAYANARYNALRSTGVASDTNSAWIYLCQISRNVGDGNSPLRTKRAAKESGDWEESATNVITMWRPFMGMGEKDKCVRMFLAKNRMGRELEAVLHWNGAKGNITDMSQEELQTYLTEIEPEEIALRKANKPK